jgi:hypothetical protein
MNSYQPSRALNQNSFFFGLDMWDLVGLASVLVLSQKIGLEELIVGAPVIATLTAAFMLAPIRMRYRRGIIRDSVMYWSEYAAGIIIKRLS